MKQPGPADTICAISTPFGEGGIGIIRISGPKATAVADQLFQGASATSLQRVLSHTLHYGQIIDPGSGERVDEVLIAVMRSPQTYTREDIVEIQAHGNPILLQRILGLILGQGVRLADPGEFTKRAFLNGRIDLTEAEATMDLIQAKTEAGCRAAMMRLEGALGIEINELRQRLIALIATLEAHIDFPEEDLEPFPRSAFIGELRHIYDRVDRLLGTAEEGRILREGLATVIVGQVNVGKSSLLNRLLKFDRAIVTSAPGTTRDTLEEILNIKGIPLRVIDTAGLRSTDDPIELEGIRRTEDAIKQAELLLVVVEGQRDLEAFETEFIKRYSSIKKMIVVINKTDLSPEGGRAIQKKLGETVPSVMVSATRGDGMGSLRDAISSAASGRSHAGDNGLLIAQLRHKTALLASKEQLGEVLQSLEAEATEELLVMDLRGALNRLGEIVGETTNEDILDLIFKTFCIGK